MSASPKAVAVDFLRAREHGDLEKVMELLSEDAIFTDGPRGVHRGASAIRAVLSEIGARAPTVTRTVKSMVADDTTVMMERVDTFAVGGTAIHYEIAVVFEIDGRGRIKRWHEYYDLKSIADHILAAGASHPGS
jgi:limonene-1,2-epoxide hydrolase